MRWSVRTELAAFSLVAVLILVGLAAFLYTRELSEAESDAESHGRFQAGLAAGAVDESLGILVETVSGLAAQPGLAAVLEAPEACSLALRGVGVFPGARLDVVTTDGRVACSSQPAADRPADADHAGAPWLADARDGVLLSSAFGDSISGGRAVAAAAPVAGAEGVAGVVALVAPFAGMVDAIQSVYGGPDELGFVVVAGAEVVTADAVVRAEDLGAAFSEPSGSWAGPDGVRRLYGSAVVADTGWQVFGGRDRSDVVAAARESLLAAATLAVFVAVAMAALLVLVNRRIVRPVRRVAAALEEAAHTPAPAALDVAGPREIVDLAARFEEMVRARRDYESRLAHQALHDRLTGLPNRALCFDRLVQALEREPVSDGFVGVVLCDLVGFRGLNERLGYDVGDRVLGIAAERLTGIARPGDTVARLGGDDFAIIGEGLADQAHLDRIVADIEEAMETPLAVDGHEIGLRLWIGAALSDSPHTGPEELLQGAEVAMREARGSPAAGYTLYDDALRRRTDDRLTLDRDLRSAVQHQELQVVYQPIVALASGRVESVEALVRWNHPTRGPIPPLVFVSVAEESDLITSIGRFVLEQSCEQAARWVAAGQPVDVSVNVSPRQLERGDLAPTVEEILTRNRLAPHRLCLEITESVLMQASTIAMGTIARLRDLGVRFAIDDFGVGYSSLAYLRDLPVDALKIDRSFIADAQRPGPGRELVAAIIAMAQALGLQLVAEGVESTEQAALLRDLDCPAAQGHLFSRPLAAEDLPLVLRPPAVGQRA